MTYEYQSVWGGLIAVYLFLGGLGGTVLALSVLADLLWPQEEPDRRPAIFGAIAGIILLAIGTVFLLIDLLQPMKAYYAMLNPHSWIFWGVLFITLYFVSGVLYVLPYLQEWPIIKKFQRILAFLAKWQKPLGISAAVLGFLVALYTGFLLSTAPAIPFWNTPALPLLFLVSGTSTGSALLMLYLAWNRQRTDYQVRLVHFLEKLDVFLIGTELLILGAYFNYFRTSAEAGRLSAQYLLTSVGFMGGFLLLGLLAPLIIELRVWQLGRKSPHLKNLARAEAAATSDKEELVRGNLLEHAGWIMLAALLVLMGGFLLRWYVLAAGIYGYPFPS